MPNIYYCHALSQGSGMLRAVLSWEEAKQLVGLHSVRYVGEQFPAMDKDAATDFAVLRAFETEPDKEWQVGFYCFDANITQIEDGIQTCTSRLPLIGA
jgi:hypothetical protein